MSFLRALRAYIGLAPDDEIEDRYLSELNARRRELALDELDSDRAPGRRRNGRDRPVGAGGDGRRRRSATERDARSATERDARGATERDARGGRSWREPVGRLGADDADELDLAFIERMDRVSRARAGGHDIEPEVALETVVEAEGRDTVEIRSRGGGAARGGAGASTGGAVVRSLDSMRAKPRTLLPESFADAKVVADEFKRDIPVVLNLQAVERDLARRLIDFSSGICYVLDGKMEKLASQVFLLIPDSVEVSEEDRRRIEERGYAR